MRHYIQGALCEVAYYCHGSKTISVKLELKKLTFGKITAKHIKIHINLVEEAAAPEVEAGGKKLSAAQEARRAAALGKDEASWNVNGEIEGLIEVGKGDKDDDNAAPLLEAVFTVIFDSSVPFVSLAARFAIRPTDDMLITAMVQLTFGDYCNEHHEGNSVRLGFEMDTDVGGGAS